MVRQDMAGGRICAGAAGANSSLLKTSWLGPLWDCVTLPLDRRMATPDMPREAFARCYGLPGP